jgi:hypothetical protein
MIIPDYKHFQCCPACGDRMRLVSLTVDAVRYACWNCSVTADGVIHKSTFEAKK